jgi:O-antigen ligase
MLAVIGVFCLRARSYLLPCLLILVAGLALYEVIDISGRRFDLGSGLDESMLERLRAWRGALDMAIGDPVFGVGLGNFASSLAEYRPGRAIAAHSTWLGVLGETGLPGFLTFILLAVATIRSGLRSRAALSASAPPAVMPAFAMGTISATAGFCVAGSFLTHGFSWPLYMIIALTAALSHHVTERMPSFTATRMAAAAA